jgi:hypothetical protein
MKYLTITAAILLGALFLMASISYFLGFGTPPPMAAGSPMAQFFGAFVPTGYMGVVKSFELIGAILVIIPTTRRAGLLILGPIIVNIITFHLCIMKDGLLDPMVIVAALLALFLVWVDRRSFAAFLRGV